MTAVSPRVRGRRGLRNRHRVSAGGTERDRLESRTEPVTGKFERIGATWTVVFPSLSVHAC